MEDIACGNGMQNFYKYIFARLLAWLQAVDSFRKVLSLYIATT